MGKPIKIANLAEDMIRLSGFAKDDISIVYTGLRPGEKLHEELFLKEETIGKTPHEKIFSAQSDPNMFQSTFAKIEDLIFLAQNNTDNEILKEKLLQYLDIKTDTATIPPKVLETKE